MRRNTVRYKIYSSHYSKLLNLSVLRDLGIFRGTAKLPLNRTEVTSTHHNRVAVLNELSLCAVGHGDGLGAAPRDFKHGAEGALFGATDGSTRHHVTSAKVAAVDRVVGQLLAHVPVHVTEIRAADDLA